MKLSGTLAAGLEYAAELIDLWVKHISYRALIFMALQLHSDIFDSHL